MKTILVPTDFSKCAYVAAHFAVELAKITKSKIILLNTFQIPMPPPESFVTPISFTDLQEESLKQLKNMADIELRTNKEYAELEIEYEAVMGSTVSGIIDAAKRYDAGMVIMGTQGASGMIKEIILGSNTASLIAKAPCPIFAIPENAKFSGLKKIIFAIDFHEIKNDSVLNPLKELGLLFDSEIDIFSIITKQEQKAFMEKEIERINSIKIFEHISHSFHIILNEDIQLAIDNYVKETNADILVTMPQKHNFLELLFNKSITRQLAFHVKIPLLCLPLHSD